MMKKLREKNMEIVEKITIFALPTINITQQSSRYVQDKNVYVAVYFS